jgi:ABC-type nitrate/sulfonate/bicarbonate transport system permease component
MWFGVSDLTPLVAAAIASFPFVTQSVYKGIRDIDSGIIEMSSSFGVSRRRFVRRAVIRSVLPEWFAGARYSFAICWKIVTLAELVAAENGLGFMIERQMSFLSLTGVISWTLLFTLVIAVLEYGVLQQIEKRAFAWRKETDVSMGVGG